MNTGLATDQIGVPGPVQVVMADRSSVEDFAAATSSAREVRIGEALPLLYGVVPTRTVVVEALNRLIPAGLAATVPVLHGEHLLRRIRAPRVGDRLLVRATPLAVEIKSGGTTAAVVVELSDSGGTLLETHELTSFLPGVYVGSASGVRTALQCLPDRRVEPTRRMTVSTSPDQSRRYAAATGDDSPFHVSDDEARRYGFPGVILHGLCTLAVTLNLFEDELRRAEESGSASVRFAHPGAPGAELAVEAWDDGAEAVAFRCTDETGSILLNHGRLSW